MAPDGRAEQLVVADVRIVLNPGALACDWRRRWLYWVDFGFRAIKRIALDDHLLTSPTVETVVSGSSYATFALAVKVDDVDVYWADTARQVHTARCCWGLLE